MKANIAHKSVFAFILAALIDQFHKFYMIKVLGWQGGELITVTPFFDYVLVWNPGISYGLFSFIPAWGLIVMMLVACSGLAYWWATSPSNLVRWGLAITLGGAVGNIADRLVYGAVADFFSFHAYGFNWYIFNLADVAIALGLAALVWDMFTSKAEKA
ncbi:signal peptidase II [Maritalea porphyrae]|uniref:Lipoprotein signal peptidase n=1 Tax=Maritalea porphyrae TaxID=880732 RepID=A0ABQ5URG5_9HYPH|nr:signal peptidase II [Maritalea porphyrae]GLQ17742.1 lipoprotein signal peptidase [Maritalea porphyrae]